MKKLPLIFTILLLTLVSLLHAEIKLPAIVSSNMVLQRNTTVVLWGWADKKEKITIELSWVDTPLQVTAEKDGSWQIDVETTNDLTPQVIKLKSKTSDITLDNILFGEVWLCSGQSNMQQPVAGYRDQPTFGTNKAIIKSNNPNLRLFTVNCKGSKTPINDLVEYIGWESASPENVGAFSAVAYFFGQQLQETLHVPVGMIHTSWGGSSVQAWMSKEVISQYQQFDLDTFDIDKRTNHIPTALYNSMIHPLIPYTIKGALWYQGESNRMEPPNYKKMFPAMVKDWRERWDIGDFPFYFVQIAPYWYNNFEVFSTPQNSAFIREVQLQCVDLIPNSGIAITMDIGDDYCIHPPKKKEVADRLLFIALHHDYGYESLDYAGPEYDSLEIKNNEIILHFKHAERGLYTFDKLEGFEIAGEDKVFYPAEATIKRRKGLFVKSDKVPNPVAVRYAWTNWIEGTLFDTSLLPASSFRTDSWDDATRAEEK